MRRSPTHRLIGLAIALSLGAALVPAPGGVASASLIGEVLPPVKVELPSLATVETAPTPKVEVPGVATVRAPTAPHGGIPVLPVTVTTPSVPPVTTPSVPPVGSVTTPSLPSTSTSTSTPTPTVPVAGTSPSAAAASTAPGANARGASTTAAAAAGDVPGQASATRGGGVKAAASPGRVRRRSSRGAHDHGAAAVAVPSAQPLGGATRRARSAASTSVPARSTARAGSHKSSSSNPLEEIGRRIPFPVPVPDWSKPIILLLLLLALWFAARSRLAALRARRLERQRAVLLGDLDSMQAALVPEIPGRLGDLSVSAAYRPADGPAAGGDFYDLFVLEPGKVAIVLGDVAGHGRGALTQAALTRYTLRAYMQAGLEPRAALSLAGSVLAEPGELQFATVLAAIYDTVNARLTYASAGHDPPISIGFATAEPPTVCCSAPVGSNLPTGRRQTTLSVPAGGRVCFFSDGLVEARTLDGLLGRERLAEIVAGLGPSDGAPALLQRVREDAVATPDDMVACIVSAAVTVARPADDATAHVEELEVDREALIGPHVPVFLRACGVEQAEIAPLLARADELVDEHSTALLRSERSRAGQVTIVALPGRSLLVAKAAIARSAEQHSLALPLARAAV